MTRLPMVRESMPVRQEAFDPLLPPPDRPPVGSGVLFGMATLAIAGLVFGGWSALAPISSAAVAPGVLTVDTMRKVIQHAEGGSIAELLVREGERVQAGQVLVRLDDLESKALHDVLDGRSTALSAQRARLLAEREERDTLVFPAKLETQRARAEVAEILGGQQRIFSTGRDSLQGQVEVLGARIAGFKAQAAALDSQFVAGREQLAFIQEELDLVRTLVAKGLERRPRLLALERTAAGTQGQQGDLQNRIAQVQEGIAGAQLEIINAKRTRTERAALELRDVETQLTEVDQKLAEARVKLARRDVIAPQTGTVLDLRYHTVGGVVPPGGKLLDLVPVEDRLIVEARIKPTDIDVVHIGLSAKVALSAYKTRTTPQLDGRVSHVSADALADDRNRSDRPPSMSASPAQNYFTARIEIDASQLARLQGINLSPGMPAEVFIETGSRTLIAYLLQPLTDSFRRAFRED